MLAAQWKLPPLLTTPMAFHHDPERVQDPSLRKLDGAGAPRRPAAPTCSSTSRRAARSPPSATLCLEQYQMTEADCDALLDDIGKQTREVASLFEINIGASARLRGHPQEGQRGPGRAHAPLAAAGHRPPGTGDASSSRTSSYRSRRRPTRLTGLANRARFDEFLAEQFAAGRATRKPLSLLLLDVDKFKSINDTHGHQTGDQVLRGLGKLLATAARAAGPGRPVRRGGNGPGPARHEPLHRRRHRREHPPRDLLPSRSRAGTARSPSPRASASPRSSPAARSASPPTC